MPSFDEFRAADAKIADYRLYDENGDEYPIIIGVTVSPALMTMTAATNQPSVIASALYLAGLSTMSALLFSPSVTGAAVVAAGNNTASALLLPPTIIAFGRRRLFGSSN